jgi:hypothetical protein
MANTPRYTFVQPPIFGAAIESGIKAMGGIAQEQAASQKNKALLNSFANTLEREGLLADAGVYRNYAAAEQPNFMRAAATGVAEKRNTDMPFEHALKIIQAKQSRETALDVAGIRSTGSRASMTRAEFGARSYNLDADSRGLQDEIGRLDRTILSIRAQIPALDAAGRVDEANALRREVAKREAALNGKEAELRGIRDSRNNLTNEFYPASNDTTSTTSVPTGGTPLAAGAEGGGGVSFEPTAGSPSGELTPPTAGVGGEGVLPQNTADDVQIGGKQAAPYSDAQGGDASIPEGKAVPEDTELGARTLKALQDDAVKNYPNKEAEIRATTSGPALTAFIKGVNATTRTATSATIYPDSISAMAAGEKMRSVMAAGNNYDVVLAPRSGGTTFGLRAKPTAPAVWDEGSYREVDGKVYTQGPGGQLVPATDKNGKPITALQFKEDMKLLQQNGVTVPQLENANTRDVTNQYPANLPTGPAAKKMTEYEKYKWSKMRQTQDWGAVQY